MSAIQRWDMFAEVGINEPVKYDMWEAVEGRYVLYADHVAAVAAAEQRAGEEAHGHYMDGYAAALDAARDAVAAVVQGNQMFYTTAISDALAAIDGLTNGKKEA